jgi:hypothetical protein
VQSVQDVKDAQAAVRFSSISLAACPTLSLPSQPLSHVTATREVELSVHLSSSYFGLHFQSVTLLDCTRANIFLHLTTSHPSPTPLLDELEISL